MTIDTSINGSNKYHSTSFNITSASVEFLDTTPKLDEDGYHVITLAPEDLDLLIGTLLAAKRNIGPRAGRLIGLLINAKETTESSS